MELEFERPLLELERKVAELKKLSLDGKIDLSREIEALEQKVESLKEEIYSRLTPWEIVQLARHPQRPVTSDYIETIFTDFFELHGDRKFGDDPAIMGGLARFQGKAVMVIGHQKGKDTKANLVRNFGMASPEGFRKAGRLMELAAKFSHPIITFIDTPGAYPGKEAEEKGQYEAIAGNIKLMLNLPVPIISLVIGEGGSGGAIGIGAANRVLMLENSIYSVISPEGCASILWRDAQKAREAAAALWLTAPQLKQLNLIDEIIPEILGGAHREKEKVFAAVKEALQKQLEKLKGKSGEQLRKERWEKFLNLGVFAQEKDRKNLAV